jgi:hypothetical protein
MNTAQVIRSWWDIFGRSPVGQFCLLVFFALGLGEYNGERSERRLAFTAQRRTRGVGRAGALGARDTGTAGTALACPVGDGGAKPPERSKPAACVPASSGAHDAGVKHSGPRVRYGFHTSICPDSLTDISSICARQSTSTSPLLELNFVKACVSLKSSGLFPTLAPRIGIPCSVTYP